MRVVIVRLEVEFRIIITPCSFSKVTSKNPTASVKSMQHNVVVGIIQRERADDGALMHFSFLRMFKKCFAE